MDSRRTQDRYSRAARRTGLRRSADRLVPPEELVASRGGGSWHHRRSRNARLCADGRRCSCSSSFTSSSIRRRQRRRLRPSPDARANGESQLPPAAGRRKTRQSLPKGSNASSRDIGEDAAEGCGDQEPLTKPAAVAPPRSEQEQRGSTRPVVLEFDKDTYVATESDGSVRIVVERHGSTQQATSASVGTCAATRRSRARTSPASGPAPRQVPAGAAHCDADDSARVGCDRREHGSVPGRDRAPRSRA